MKRDELSPRGGGARLRRIGSMTAMCPACGRRTMLIEDYLYNAPLIGLLLISTGRCRSCGYRYSDIRAAESQGPRRLVFKAKGPGDLNVIVVKSASASIIIPELGVEVTPGPASQGFITTVEGILQRVGEVLETLCADPETNREECSRRLRELKECSEGRSSFTLIIDDPEGTSRIISSKVMKEKLYSPSMP